MKYSWEEEEKRRADFETRVLLKQNQIGICLGMDKINYKGKLIQVTDDDNTPDGSTKYTYRIGGPGNTISDYFNTRQEATAAAKKQVDGMK